MWSIANPIVSLVSALPAGPVAADKPAGGTVAWDEKAGWVDEFEQFAARQSAGETPDQNVLVVAKAVPGADHRAGDEVAPVDRPKAAYAAAADDPDLTTGSIRVPVLPPVPGADAFKVHKGDRLGGPAHGDLGHASPSGTDGAAEPAAIAPHAELLPARGLAGAKLASKSSRLGSDQQKPVAIVSAAARPFDLSPGADQVFQGPPTPPGDPAVDPDAPVLGYAEQMASAEAPFRALFAVTPEARRSWLGSGPAAVKTQPKKPDAKKVAHALRHRGRKVPG